MKTQDAMWRPYDSARKPTTPCEPHCGSLEDDDDALEDNDEFWIVVQKP